MHELVTIYYRSKWAYGYGDWQSIDGVINTSLSSEDLAEDLAETYLHHWVEQNIQLDHYRGFEFKFEKITPERIRSLIDFDKMLIKGAQERIENYERMLKEMVP